MKEEEKKICVATTVGQHIETIWLTFRLFRLFFCSFSVLCWSFCCCSLSYSQANNIIMDFWGLYLVILDGIWCKKECIHAGWVQIERARKENYTLTQSHSFTLSVSIFLTFSALLRTIASGDGGSRKIFKIVFGKFFIGLTNSHCWTKSGLTFSSLHFFYSCLCWLVWNAYSGCVWCTVLNYVLLVYGTFQNDSRHKMRAIASAYSTNVISSRNWEWWWF